jgi:polysaccharide chain length determinant protein (PEP-CTERM system associated)
MLQSAERIELLRRRVMKPASLSELVQRVDPYPDRPDLTPDQKAAMIAEGTSLEPINPVTLERAKGSTAFAVHYLNPDPQVAASVTKELLNLYVTYNSRVRTEQAAAATQFLREQAKLLEESMVGTERKLAQFKSKYGDALPTSEGRNMMGADRSRRDLEDIQRRLLAAEEKESLLRVQIGELSPSLSSAVGNWRTELAKLKGELALAEQKYTPDHPDVKRLRRAIGELAVKGNSSDTSGSSEADNPEYLRVRSQLDSARREVASLRSSEARIRSELYGYEQNLATAPNVEREYVQLTRQYENTQAQYNDLQQKIKTASLTESMESESKGERFAIIQEVRLPRRPYSPNRIGIILVSLLLGGGLGVLAAVIRDASDPTVRSAKDVEGVFGSDPIATIPVLSSRADVARRRRIIGSAVAGYAAAAALSAIAILLFRN